MVHILTRPEDSGAVGAGCGWGTWTRDVDTGCGLCPLWEATGFFEKPAVETQHHEDGE